MGLEVTGNRVVLTGRCDIDVAQPLKEALLGLVEGGEGEVVVEASGIESTDLSVLQVLWSARKTLDIRGRKLLLNGASGALLKFQEDAGMMLD